MTQWIMFSVSVFALYVVVHFVCLMCGVCSLQLIVYSFGYLMYHVRSAVDSSFNCSTSQLHPVHYYLKQLCMRSIKITYTDTHLLGCYVYIVELLGCYVYNVDLLRCYAWV
jgi:hypothetical protein